KDAFVVEQRAESPAETERRDAGIHEPRHNDQRSAELTPVAFHARKIALRIGHRNVERWIRWRLGDTSGPRPDEHGGHDRVQREATCHDKCDCRRMEAVGGRPQSTASTVFATSGSTAVSSSIRLSDAPA